MSLPELSSRVAPDAVPAAPEVPLDTAVLERLANAFFRALPGSPPELPETTAAAAPWPTGVQAPANLAPAGSPLASPAGLGPSVPGTPIPPGVAPGANLIPASPSSALPSLAHRAPALVPHAVAGNGVPDTVLSALPAYEPRFGSGVQGVPQAALADAQTAPAVPDGGYYFLAPDHGSRGVPGGLNHGQSHGLNADPLDALAHAPFAVPEPRSAAVAPPPSPLLNGVPTSARPAFYFVEAQVGPGATDQPAVPAIDAGRHGAFDVHAVRRDFPILSERVHGRPLAWFDNAATTHKPQAVIDRLAHFYAHENSNIHRAAHTLAARATDAYETARETVRRFINAPDVNEVIFVRGTTEAINLVAKSWGWQHVGEGDEIIVSHLEHHANIVPWQQLVAAKGARLRVIPVDDHGQVRLDEYRKLLNDRTRLVAVTQVSNALGTVTPMREIIELAHRAGALALVDGAQSVSHMRTDVQALDADFFVFSGHKVFGPTGIGALWARRRVLEDMPPWQGGGNMIADVTFEKTVFQPIPNTFEAGTGNIADAAGLGAALDYVSRIGIEAIAQYEHELLVYGMQHLGEIPGLRLIGTAPDKASVMSFTLAGYETEEVGRALDAEGIAVRTGHHCAQPILRRFGVETTVRPSLAFYNTYEEIDRLVTVVRRLAGQR